MEDITQIRAQNHDGLTPIDCYYCGHIKQIPKANRVEENTRCPHCGELFWAEYSVDEKGDTKKYSGPFRKWAGFVNEMGKAFVKE